MQAPLRDESARGEVITPRPDFEEPAYDEGEIPPPDYGARLVRVDVVPPEVPSPRESVAPLLDAGHDWIVAARAENVVERTSREPTMGSFVVEENLAGRSPRPGTTFTVRVLPPSRGCSHAELSIRTAARYVLVLHVVDESAGLYQMVEAPTLQQGWAIRNDDDLVQFPGVSAVSMADLRDAIAERG